MSICPVCKKEFSPDGFHQNTMKFCSPRCRGKNWKLLNREKVYKEQNARTKRIATKRLSLLPPKLCPICGKSFQALEDRRHPNKTFCSTKCRQKHFNLRRKAKEAYALKHPEEDLKFYWYVRTRKQAQDANYKSLKRGCKRCSGNHLHLKDWLEIKEKHGSKCAICGILESPEAPLSIDHITAIANGGQNTSSNIQPLCRSCNSRKGNRY